MFFNYVTLRLNKVSGGKLTGQVSINKYKSRPDLGTKDVSFIVIIAGVALLLIAAFIFLQRSRSKPHDAQLIRPSLIEKSIGERSKSTKKPRFESQTYFESEVANAGNNLMDSYKNAEKL